MSQVISKVCKKCHSVLLWMDGKLKCCNSNCELHGKEQ